jgi:hypothetical protein
MLWLERGGFFWNLTASRQPWTEATLIRIELPIPGLKFPLSAAGLMPDAPAPEIAPVTGPAKKRPKW